MNSIRVFAPATVANVGPGFDVFGFAVEQPGDEVVATLSDTPGVRVIEITGDNGILPRDPEKNTAAVAVKALLDYLCHPEPLGGTQGKLCAGSREWQKKVTGFLDKLGMTADVGIELSVHKKMPLGSGLGSSAASAVAAVVAANELLGCPLSRRELLPFTMEGERVACGAAHADNVAPSLLGGFVLIRSYSPLDVVQIPVPENLWCAVVHPHIEIRTQDARSILRREVTLASVIPQWGNTAGMIAGLLMNDLGLVGRSLHDSVIEPVRSILIPGFDLVKKAACDAGALGCSLSGSGPSLFTLCSSNLIAEQVGRAMHGVWMERFALESDVFISTINTEGPRIL